MARHMIESGLPLTRTRMDRLIDTQPTIWIGKLKLTAVQIDVKRHMARFDASNVEECSRVSVFVDGLEIAVLLYDFARDAYYYPTADLIIGELNPIMRRGVETIQDVMDKAPESVIDRVLTTTLQRSALSMTKKKGLHALDTPLIGPIYRDEKAGHTRVQMRVMSRQNVLRSTYIISVDFCNDELFYAGRVNVSAFERKYNEAKRAHATEIKIINRLVATNG